ncbi:hypothetical protein RRG08_016019 [Elysia crispata]|uniref:Uncharacterized protein n=1 Tax=Elysia crispata TaxID=231223 RepID=A0AAE1D6V8_9GAST|nr:hypothetical protein RRG08_016019 [Elysia crispata]
MPQFAQFELATRVREMGRTGRQAVAQVENREEQGKTQENSVLLTSQNREEQGKTQENSVLLTAQNCEEQGKTQENSVLLTAQNREEQGKTQENSVLLTAQNREEQGKTQENSVLLTAQNREEQGKTQENSVLLTAQNREEQGKTQENSVLLTAQNREEQGKTQENSVLLTAQNREEQGKTQENSVLLTAQNREEQGKTQENSVLLTAQNREEQAHGAPYKQKGYKKHENGKLRNIKTSIRFVAISPYPGLATTVCETVCVTPEIIINPAALRCSEFHSLPRPMSTVVSPLEAVEPTTQVPEHATKDEERGNKKVDDGVSLGNKSLTNQGYSGGGFRQRLGQQKQQHKECYEDVHS